ncbi:MAG: FIST C-terminal domain-containing protein [Saprospiraceae bacterium]|nr:FIST C-terminal domain-containing protein [Saprospiraceae bacterium]
MNAKSIQGGSLRETKKLLDETWQDGFSPTLAIVFTSLKDDWKAIQDLMNDKDIALYGTSSNGEFVADQYETGTIAMLLLDLPTAYFRIEMEDLDETNVRKVARQIGESGLAAFANPGFILSGADPTFPLEEIVPGLVDVCGEEVTIMGGNSSSDSLMSSFIFTNGKRSNHGILALILDQDKVHMEGEAISGWKPLGTLKTVTECDGKWVKTLDNKPALGFLLKYMGMEIDFRDEVDLFNKIGAIYPIQIQEEDGTSSILPPLFFNEKEGSFMLAGPVKQGSKIKFSMPPDFDVMDAVIDSARERKKHTLKDAEALIIFSCVGRLNCLGPLINEEIKGLIDVWKIPSIGFFTFGEYGRVKNGKPMFHGTTVSWVALKEK